ncbi:MAG: TSUP family transporter [Clostridia bacterium]
MIEILIGMISGIVSGTGMGGGTILIFLLTFMMGIEQHVSQATNLIFFIPTSIVAIIINIKNKNIDLKLAIIIYIWYFRSYYRL